MRGAAPGDHGLTRRARLEGRGISAGLMVLLSVTLATAGTIHLHAPMLVDLAHHFGADAGRRTTSSASPVPSGAQQFLSEILRH